MQIEEHISLSPFTTFKIGGPARFFARVTTTAELEQALAFAKERQVKTFILGGGSNLLVSDTGFDGLVIKIEIQGVEENDTGFIAGAGESWDALVARAVEKQWWGIENLSGIPGTVGGAVVQNIGAYGQVLSQTLLWTEVYDATEGGVRRFTKAEYESGYRSSIFKHEPGRYIVLRVALVLSSTPHPQVEYKDLRARFEGTTPTIGDIRAAVLSIRAAKFPDLSVEGTAGSFFKNPVLSEQEGVALAARYPGLPLFSLPESKGVKVPLAWFLDYKNGVMDLREVRVGGARMYEKQFLVLTAARGTSSEDVKKLSQLVQEKIHTVLNVTLEPEVVMI